MTRVSFTFSQRSLRLVQVEYLQSARKSKVHALSFGIMKHIAYTCIDVYPLCELEVPVPDPMAPSAVLLKTKVPSLAILLFRDREDDVVLGHRPALSPTLWLEEQQLLACSAAV